jgi:hypothetical protein
MNRNTYRPTADASLPLPDPCPTVSRLTVLAPPPSPGSHRGSLTRRTSADGSSPRERAAGAVSGGDGRIRTHTAPSRDKSDGRRAPVVPPDTHERPSTSVTEQRHLSTRTGTRRP